MLLMILKEMKFFLIFFGFSRELPSNKYDSTQTMWHHSLHLPATYFLNNRNVEETNKGTMT